MLQNMVNAYMRGFQGKSPGPFGIKGSLVYKKYKEGKHDFDNGLPNRYITDNK